MSLVAGPRGTYHLLDTRGDTIATYRNNNSDQAAQKASIQGYMYIQLKEESTKRIYSYVGNIVSDDSPLLCDIFSLEEKDFN